MENSKTVSDKVITFNYVCPSDELPESTSVSGQVINFEIN
jgi:hypothetical protein